MSPGTATDGVTLFMKKLTIFLVIALCKVMTFFSCRLLTTPTFPSRAGLTIRGPHINVRRGPFLIHVARIFSGGALFPSKSWRPSFFPRCMECRRGLAMRILSVCPSFRPSVRQRRELWQNGRKLCFDFNIIRKNIYPSFLRRRMVGGATLSTWNFGSTGPR